MPASADSSQSKRGDKPSRCKRVILWVGLACCFQFLVFAGVGVARGYSIQSWTPLWVMLAGVFLVLPVSGKSSTFWFFYGLLIPMSMVSIFQGGHREKGDELYEAGKFADAMAEYSKEIDTWYLRLRYNYHESPSMFRIAQCQSQLEQFGEARETYADTTSMFRGYYKKRAEEALATLDANMAKVAEAQKSLAEEEDDKKKAFLLFDLALLYRKVDCTRKAVEQYERIQSLEIDDRFKKQARRFAEELQ